MLVLRRMIRRYPALRPLLTEWALNVLEVMGREGECHTMPFGPPGMARLLENGIGPWEEVILEVLEVATSR